jgi:hypothetical protein
LRAQGIIEITGASVYTDDAPEVVHRHVYQNDLEEHARVVVQGTAGTGKAQQRGTKSTVGASKGASDLDLESLALSTGLEGEETIHYQVMMM